MDEFTVDDKKIRDMFAELTSKDRKKVFRQAVNGALRIIKKETLNNLKSSINPHKINHKDKYGNSLSKGIKIRVYKNNRSGVIHILGNYKLKFFELGTKERYNRSRNGNPLKKPRFTGTIPAYHFFKNAYTSKEKEVFGSIDQLISKSIEKINKKYQ